MKSLLTLRNGFISAALLFLFLGQESLHTPSSRTIYAHFALHFFGLSLFRDSRKLNMHLTFGNRKGG